MGKLAIFLGAGASKAEGAPLQNELFFEYFSSPSFKNSHDEMETELATFFDLIFGIDVYNDVSKVEFPTFEEVLGLTDLAILRKEAFKDFNIENRASNSGRLRFISQHLVFLVAKLLDKKLEGSKGHHKTLTRKLLRHGKLKDTLFISTNYDILIDNALLGCDGIHLDYGVDFVNFEENENWYKPKEEMAVYLFKPHGSLNWLYCPTCNHLRITPNEKGVATKLINDFRDAACRYCESVYMPIIVPPSFYKDMSNVFLNCIWNKCENRLRNVEQVIFCGYSFPDADMHIKYLLKRVQVNSKKKFKVTVINYFEGKDEKLCESERTRFSRFFGNVVDYKRISFESFSNDPMNFIVI